VVIASGGYPGKYESGNEITGLKEAADTGAVVFHCGTAEKDGKIVTAGGRVLGVSATGKSIRNAIYNAYYGVRPISFKDMFFRKDIGFKALRRPAAPVTRKRTALAMLLFLAFAGILLVYPWAEILPAKYSNWEQVTIIRVAVFLFALLRLSVATVRKKLTYRLYCVTFITFLFIWVFSQLMLRPYPTVIKGKTTIVTEQTQK
jgi:hypothetical protein